jgi:hypothetical protein
LYQLCSTLYKGRKRQASAGAVLGGALLGIVRLVGAWQYCENRPNSMKSCSIAAFETEVISGALSRRIEWIVQSRL